MRRQRNSESVTMSLDAKTGTSYQRRVGKNFAEHVFTMTDFLGRNI